LEHWGAAEAGRVSLLLTRIDMQADWTKVLGGCGSHPGQIFENLIEQTVVGCPKLGRGDAQNGD
jgi:hypothetical protein